MPLSTTFCCWDTSIFEKLSKSAKRYPLSLDLLENIGINLRSWIINRRTHTLPLLDYVHIQVDYYNT